MAAASKSSFGCSPRSRRPTPTGSRRLRTGALANRPSSPRPRPPRRPRLALPRVTSTPTGISRRATSPTPRKPPDRIPAGPRKRSGLFLRKPNGAFMQIIDHGGAPIGAPHDKKVGSWQYVVSAPVSRKCAIIDPVWDFDEKAAATSTRNADAILDYVKAEGLTVEWLLDTHPHADHFSAAPFLNEKLGAPTAIGEKVIGVQKLWKDIYGLDDDFPADGRQWDRLFKAGDTFAVGDLPAGVMFSPGHTMASITYVIGGNAFVHDTLMIPYAGTSRADFPGGDSKTLFRSIQDILALPEETAVFVGHDYGPDGREPACFSTVREQKADNIHVGGGRGEADFVRLRDDRDATLPLPNLMLYALQVNIRGGGLPPAAPGGRGSFTLPP